MSPQSKVFTYFGMLCLFRQPIEEESTMSHIDLIYIRDADCPQCRKWEETQLFELRTAVLFQQVRFTQVTKGLYPFAPSSPFPIEISHLQVFIAEKIRSERSPFFAVLIDGAIVSDQMLAILISGAEPCKMTSE